MKYLLCILSAIHALFLFSQPVALDESVSIREVMSVENNCARIDFDPATNELYYVTIDGKVKKVNVANGTAETIFTSTDHGLGEVYGFEIGTSGNIYLVSMATQSGNNVATIKRRTDNAWVTMATATYPTSSRDHRFNAVIETPDEEFILVNSGARTDHGELKSNNQRENAFTAKLLKLPVDATNITLLDDEDFMENNGYIFAHGLRNTFDIEYAPNGELFGLDNADQSDHHEEMNWIREGYHYEFPWRIGDNWNLQQFPGYDPPDSDPLVTNVTMESTFHNDPTFPPPPAGANFMRPIISHGPDADLFRDTVDAAIKDASAVERTLGTFTPHSSPLGLTFDVDSVLDGVFKGRGYAFSFSHTADRKFVPFDEVGEDLLLLDLVKTEDNYEVNVFRLAQGFKHPVDATMIGNKIYMIENGNGSSIWEITLPLEDGVTEPTGIPAGHGLANLKVVPNPFDRSVNVRFSLLEPGYAQVKVYSVEGKEIKTLIEGNDFRRNEMLFADWDGTDSRRNPVAPGVYIVTIRTSKGQIHERVIRR